MRLVDSGLVARPALVAFERGLQVHLTESRQQLVGLPADVDAQRTMLMMRMVQENRSVPAAAERNGAGDLARVLRAFEADPDAARGDDITPAEAPGCSRRNSRSSSTRC